MRIGSFNLENLGRRFADAAFFRERLAVLGPQVARLDADVLCLQEVDGVKAPGASGRSLEALEALLEAADVGRYALAASVRRETGRPAEQHNLVVASRLPIRAHRQYLNDLVPALRRPFLAADPPDAAPRPVPFDRPVLHAEIALRGGRTLHVLDLHFKAPVASPVPGGKASASTWASTAAWAEGYYLSAIKRAGQALEARLAIDAVLDAEPDALIALAGDFNAEANETPLSIVAAPAEETGNARLAARSLSLLDHAVPDWRRFTVIHRGRKVMLDHLLASRALMAAFRGLEIHNEALLDETVALAGEGPWSFHAPVVAVFDL